jgi:dolichol-phosphate mannosyltransferase
MAELSVVTPVYGCEPCLRTLHARLVKALSEVTDDYEIVFVDDRSPDGAWNVITEIGRADPAVRGVRLSRNFGQHAAVTAGLAESTGRWVVVMDCDLQDPPEHIPRMYAKALEGYDVVLSRRRRRTGSFPRRIAAGAYHRLRNRLLGSDMFTNYTNLSLISRKVVNAFLTLRDKDRQYLLILHWLGYRRTELEVDQSERPQGSSAYTWRKLLRVAVDGVFFQSTQLLRWIVYAGFLLAMLGIALAAYTLIVFAFGRELPDWTGLPVLLLVLTGFIIISTGITGLYVGKIFDQVKGRPLFVIDSKLEDGVETSFSHAEPDAAAVRAAEP